MGLNDQEPLAGAKKPICKSKGKKDSDWCQIGSFWGFLQNA